MVSAYGGRRFHHGSRNDNEPREPRSNHSSQPQFNTEVLKESEIGVTEYVNKATDGFSGIIKARYSDFHVNEIHLNGTIAKLTDLSIPKDIIGKATLKIQQICSLIRKFHFS